MRMKGYQILEREASESKNETKMNEVAAMAFACDIMFVSDDDLMDEEGSAQYQRTVAAKNAEIAQASLKGKISIKIEKDATRRSLYSQNEDVAASSSSASSQSHLRLSAPSQPAAPPSRLHSSKPSVRRSVPWRRESLVKIFRRFEAAAAVFYSTSTNASLPRHRVDPQPGQEVMTQIATEKLGDAIIINGWEEWVYKDVLRDLIRERPLKPNADNSPRESQWEWRSKEDICSDVGRKRKVRMTKDC